MPEYQRILEYWFENVDDSTIIRNNASPFNKWFSGGRDIDLEIKEKFESDLINAIKGNYQSWEMTPPGLLALIILFDQFSRNIYRNTPQMYDFDSSALNLVTRLVKSGEDKKLKIVERMFVYLPFSHSEDLAIQEQGLRCLEEIVEEAKQKYPGNAGYYEKNLHYANRHYEIIRRFNRFPHRNDILSRASTKEETQFLNEPYSKF